jgi:hypothetical protein
MTHDSQGSRDGNGRFRPGNSGGPGNPFARRTAKLRTALLRAVKPDDIEAAVAKLVEKAKAGELPAIKELLDRCLGRPKETVEQELAILQAKAEQRASLDFALATAAEVRDLRQIRGRILSRMRCGRCAAGGEPCPDHR